MKLGLPKKYFTAAIVLLGIFAQGSGFDLSGLDITRGDILQSAGDAIAGIGSEVLDNLPTVQDLVYTSTQVLFGLPENAVATLLDEACSAYVASGRVDPRITPNPEEMYFQLRTPCKNISIPLLQAEKLADLPEFDVTKKVVLFVSGWTTKINETDHIQAMARAYNCRGGYNFLYVNTSNFIQTLYSWSALNTDEIGILIADGLVRLIETVPVENIHIIGHSLGAHIVGSAGREFTQLTGKLLPRITGLDPANPCFNEGQRLSGISRGDAAFVDIIHTNPGVAGKAESLGDVDFYPGGAVPVKPGCTQFGCSHSRAYQYYIESVYPGNERNFLAKRCSSLRSLKSGRCEGPEYPMGYATPSNLTGNYYLSVNPKEPFGKNAPEGAIIEPTECGRCENQ